jgi:hypothetical protein
MVWMVQHVFAEIALTAVGGRDGIAALGVAVFAAGNIFGRAGLDVVGSAERVVVISARNHRRLPPLETASQQWRNQQQHDERGRNGQAHAQILSIVPKSAIAEFDPALTRQSIENKALR